MTTTTTTPKLATPLMRAAGLVQTFEGRTDILSEVEAYQDIRNRVLSTRFLPYWEAEDLATEVWAEAKSRSEVLPLIPVPTDDELAEAITLRRKSIRNRKEVSTEDLSLGNTPVTYLDEYRADGLCSPAEAYKKALALRVTLRLPDLASVVAALTIGLTYASTAETAEELGIKVRTFEDRIQDGRRHILSRIGTPNRVLELMDSEASAVLRTARPTGTERDEPTYRVGLSKSRTARATVLISLPQRPGMRQSTEASPGWSERTRKAEASEVIERPGLNRVEAFLMGGRTEGYSTRPETAPMGRFSPGRDCPTHRTCSGPVQGDSRRDDIPTAVSPAGTRGTPAEVLRWIADLEAVTSEREHHPAEWWPNGITAGQAHYVWPHPAIRRSAAESALMAEDQEGDED